MASSLRHGYLMSLARSSILKHGWIFFPHLQIKKPGAKARPCHVGGLPHFPYVMHRSFVFLMLGGHIRWTEHLLLMLSAQQMWSSPPSCLARWNALPFPLWPPLCGTPRVRTPTKLRHAWSFTKMIKMELFRWALNWCRGRWWLFLSWSFFRF